MMRCRKPFELKAEEQFLIFFNNNGRLDIKGHKMTLLNKVFAYLICKFKIELIVGVGVGVLLAHHKDV